MQFLNKFHTEKKKLKHFDKIEKKKKNVNVRCGMVWWYGTMLGNQSCGNVPIPFLFFG